MGSHLVRSVVTRTSRQHVLYKLSNPDPTQGTNTVTHSPCTFAYGQPKSSFDSERSSMCKQLNSQVEEGGGRSTTRTTKKNKKEGKVRDCITYVLCTTVYGQRCGAYWSGISPGVLLGAQITSGLRWCRNSIGPLPACASQGFYQNDQD